jgi:hypothetical protein
MSWLMPFGPDRPRAAHPQEMVPRFARLPRRLKPLRHCRVAPDFL